MGGVSNPTNFTHKVHVGFDPVSGGFTGLPDEWEKLLTASAITREDYAKNPQAVIEVLEFYSDRQKTQQDMYGMTGPSNTLTSQQPMGSLGGTSFLSEAGDSSNAARSYSQPSQDADVMAREREKENERKYRERERERDLQMQQREEQLRLEKEQIRQREREAQKEREQSQQRQRENDSRERELNMKEKQAREAERVREEARQQQDQEEYQRQEQLREREQRKRAEQQEILVQSGGGASTTPRYNPMRAAPSAPGASSGSAARQQPPASLRTGNTPQQRPQAPTASQSSTSVNKIQGTSSSQQSSQRTPGSSSQRTESPGQQAKAQISQSQSRAPAGNGSQVKPLNVQPKVNQAQIAAQNAAKEALTSKKDKDVQKSQRISNMSEGQVMEKLRQVVSQGDPNQSYTKIKKVGQGASGSVYVAKVNASAVSQTALSHLSTKGGSHRVAIKQMDLAHQPRKELIVNEILVMKESQHPNIVNFLDAFLKGNTELWVIMEYMEGGALTDVIDNNTLEEDQIASICFEVSLMRQDP